MNNSSSIYRVLVATIAAYKIFIYSYEILTWNGMRLYIASRIMFSRIFVFCKLSSQRRRSSLFLQSRFSKVTAALYLLIVLTTILALLQLCLVNPFNHDNYPATSLLNSSISHINAPVLHHNKHPTTVKHPYFLVATIFNRIFKEDEFNITAKECRQWIQYMIYAGVDRIHWYDTAHSEEESQQKALEDYVRAGLVIYNRFYNLFPKKEGADFHYEQDSSYRHFIDHYRESSVWTLIMDVDEYPFLPSDLQPYFLSRYVKRLEVSRLNVSQILLQCLMFGGDPEGDPDTNWLIERYKQRKQKTEVNEYGNFGRGKPIFKNSCLYGVTDFNPHVFPMKTGKTITMPAEEIRMNHYWGRRLTGYKPKSTNLDTLLLFDNSIQPIASRLKNRSSSIPAFADPSNLNLIGSYT